MVGHRRAPSVEHGGDADAGAEMPGIGGDGEQRLGRRAEQQVVDHRLVLVGDCGDLGRQGEDQVEVADRQQIGLAGGEPVPRRRALALGTMAVAAGVVRRSGVWPQSSQRSTWPPRAAERQCSMADITLSWPRLTCPALARRQAAPWRWKMSATSSLGRRMAAGLHSGSRLHWAERREPVEWAGHGADRGIGDAGVKGRGVELCMAEQNLDDADVSVLFQQVRGKAVAQCVRRHTLLDPCGIGRGVDGAVELAGGERLERIAAGKQPASRQQHTQVTTLSPPGAQQFEQLRRQHGVAVPRFREGRLLRPLPCSTRSSMRSEATSPTLRATTSETRSPAPHGSGLRPARGQAPAVANAALYFGPGAAWSSTVTSSTLSTAGNRRGSRTIVSRRARPGRSSVTVKKKRKAATALLTLGGRTPVCAWCS